MQTSYSSLETDPDQMAFTGKVATILLEEGLGGFWENGPRFGLAYENRQ